MIKTGRNTFHTTFYYENDAMNGRIKDSYDEISHKIPTEWSHDGEVAMGACVAFGHLLTICVHHANDVESLKALLYFLCIRFWRETDRNSNPTKEER